MPPARFREALASTSRNSDSESCSLTPRVICPAKASPAVRATVVARVTGDGLPVLHRGTATFAPETIRRPRPQSGAAFATRTGFADEDSLAWSEASVVIGRTALVGELQALLGGLSS